MMPVYVDPLFDTTGWSTHWPYPEACHLMADSEEELHHFAVTRMRMRRAWFQAAPPHSLAHYDLTTKRRAAAVKLGAIEVCAGFRPSRRHFRWTANGQPIAQHRETSGGVPFMKIPTHWPGGEIMRLEYRIHFMSFICGVVLCETCGDLVAKCGCGKEDLVNTVPTCPTCRPDEHRSPHAH